jgi:hypothetical protein
LQRILSVQKPYHHAQTNARELAMWSCRPAIRLGTAPFAMQPPTLALRWLGLAQVQQAVQTMMSGASQFRKFAEACAQMAQDETFTPHRARLMEMAAAWRRLAEEADRFDRLIREMDEAFEPPRARELQRSH